jgi:EAL domain-containing protein (putative c-di-GMP-specific phosphodiesterase class I)
LQLKALTCTSLILEMTEDDNLMLQKNIVKEHMARLKEKGCRFAIDDFGIEYSGLSYISEFDFDIVKTDKIFIDDKDQNTAILKSIIAFCNELDIDCIAEGIETKDDNEKINQIGIHLHQGWYHGRPVSAEKITAYTVPL